uniref:Uncharacterized protein n=1 Tax=Cannabis sativa TaxID=3483 RepID=A0A803QR36_CANSA
MFCCLGTLLVILLFFISTAEAGDQHKIHAVRHGGGDGKGGGCKGGFEPENGKLSTTTVSVGSASTLEDDDDSADSDDQASKPDWTLAKWIIRSPKEKFYWGSLFAKESLAAMLLQALRRELGHPLRDGVGVRTTRESFTSLLRLKRMLGMCYNDALG